MFTHHKLIVYGKAVAYAGFAEASSSGWTTKHSVVDHFRRASESIVLNIAEGARLNGGPAKLITLDYALGSTLECAACLDIGQIKELLASHEVSAQKHRLLEITRMLIGLRRSWCDQVLNEESMRQPDDDSSSEVLKLFHHETLDVYQVGLEFMRWLNCLPGAKELNDRTYRHLDKSATSLVLNIAEGNGRYSELDHRRFLDLAAASAVKSAAYLDLCQEKSSPIDLDISFGQRLLGRITAMLSGF